MNATILPIFVMLMHPVTILRDHITAHVCKDTMVTEQIALTETNATLTGQGVT